VAGDEVYGADPGLRAELDAQRVGYVLAIAGNRRPPIPAGLFFWRPEEAAAPLVFARDYLFDLTPEMGALIAGLSASPEPFVSAALHGVPGFAVLVVSWGDAEEHTAAVAPLRARRPAFELVTPIPYVALQQMLDPTGPEGSTPTTSRSTSTPCPTRRSRSSSPGCPAGAARCPWCRVPLFPLRGRVREISDDATAYGPPRSRRWTLSAEGVAADEESLAGERQWARDLWTALRPYAPDAGAYANLDADTDTDIARVRITYGEQKYRRLAALKAEWDPDNVFRSNMNVGPEPATAGIPAPAARRRRRPPSRPAGRPPHCLCFRANCPSPVRSCADRPVEPHPVPQFDAVNADVAPVARGGGEGVAFD
jgi:Berberine and berberine like